MSKLQHVLCFFAAVGISAVIVVIVTACVFLFQPLPTPPPVAQSAEEGDGIPPSIKRFAQAVDRLDEAVKKFDPPYTITPPSKGPPTTGIPAIVCKNTETSIDFIRWITLTEKPCTCGKTILVEEHECEGEKK